MAKQMTPAKIVILRSLEKQSLKFAALRREYFGEGRAKEKATTSFYTKLNSMIEDGLVTKLDNKNGYEISETGREALVVARDAGMDIVGAKSGAQIDWEQKHPEGVAGKAAAAVKPTVETEVEA